MARKLLTESQKFQRLRSALRQITMRSYPVINEAKRLAKTPSGYLCAQCKGEFKSSEVAVDHIEPAGSLRGYEDLPGFLLRLFCNIDGLQVLCHKCHDIKTYQDKHGLDFVQAGIEKEVVKFKKLSTDEQKDVLVSLSYGKDKNDPVLRNAKSRSDAFREYLKKGSV